MQEDERRVHARVQVTAEVRISGPTGGCFGELQDLSKGGASVKINEKVGELGDTVEVLLPIQGESEVAIAAEIVRVRTLTDGFNLGLRFSMVEPAMEAKLMGLIEILLDSRGSKTRRHPRIARRLPITFGKIGELKAILENISLGGLSMIVTTPLVLFEEIEVSVPNEKNKEFLILNARVLHQHPVSEGKNDGYRVGLEFKNLSSVARRCLEELMHHILELTAASK